MTQEEPRIRLVMELRRLGIKDLSVLSAMERVPRDEFVPAPFRERGWDNLALPIGNGQTISQPHIVAFMSEALEVGDRHKVLEIGTGTFTAPAIGQVQARRRFNLDHIGTPVGELAHCRRAGTHTRQVDYTETGQRALALSCCSHGRVSLERI